MADVRSDDSEVGKLRRHQEILLDLSRVAGRKISLAALMQQSAVQVARAVEIDHVKLLRYRSEAADLIAEAGIGWHEGVVGAATFAVDLSSPPGRAFQTGEPVGIPDLAAEPEFKTSRILHEHGIVALLNVPILVDGAAWGVLEVDSTVPREFSEDTITFMLAVACLIGAHVRREQAEQAQAEAAASAARQAQEREVLLREMQHRVKNNFQIILAMLAHQKPKFPTEVGRGLVDEISRKVMAVSLAHDQLSPTQDAEVVKLPIYLQALTTSIEQPLENVAIEVSADELEAPIEQAVPIGLIVNELITNSVKHAFSDRGGAVRVSLEAGVGHGEARLTVADDGGGIDESKPQGSGLKLIRALARQIGGRVDQETSDSGTEVSVVFPVLTTA